MTKLEMNYYDEKQRTINDANRHNPATTTEDSRSAMLLYFEEQKRKEAEEKAKARKVNGMAYSYRPENNGRDSKDGKHFVYNNTHYIDIVGRKVAY